MESVSTVLYVCSLDAVLWGHLPVIGYRDEPLHSKCGRATASEEGQATPAFPPPSTLLPSCPPSLHQQQQQSGVECETFKF